MIEAPSRPTLRASLRALPFPVWILFGGTFINRFGSFVMVFLVAYLTGRGFSPAAAGTALAAYGIGHASASWIGGHLADVLGRRRTIAVSMFSSAVAVLLLSQAEGYWTIVALAALTGLAAELYRPASSALIADLTLPESRVTAFAVYRLAINLGFAAGPATAGFLASRSFLYLFIGDAITSVVFGVIALVALPELPLAKAPEGETAQPVVAMLRNTRFVMFLLASACVSFVFFQAESSFPLHVLAAGFDSATYGYLISINGVMIVLLELWITTWTQRFRADRVMALGFLLVGLGFAVNGFGPTLGIMIGATVVWTAGEIISAPVAGPFVSALAPEHLRGRYMGAWAMTWSVGLILGPALGTLIFQWSPLALWIVCGALGVVASVLVLEIARPVEEVFSRTAGEDGPGGPSSISGTARNSCR